MAQANTLSIVVPVYNSEQSLRLLAEALRNVLPNITSAYELILVNDASRDRSWDIVRQLTQTHSWITGINLMRNYGQHNALLCGIRAAQYETIVTMDDDLQHSPDDIVKLLNKLSEGYDVVYGTPEHEQHGLLRDMASQVTKFVLQQAMGADTARHVSAFRVFRTHIRDAFERYQGPYVSIDVLLTWGTTRFAAVRVPHVPRKYGVSNYTIRKLIVHTFNMMTGFSVLPLQLASLLGFGFTFFGVVVFFYVIGRYILEGGSVQGFPFLASIIAIFSGVQLFTLGVIGEYLARMHFRLMDKPAFTVRECISGRETTQP
jgi:undecaprenyl-phosphate 4-deoxy-4-formamido-L-arabinose transferase